MFAFDPLRFLILQETDPTILDLRDEGFVPPYDRPQRYRNVWCQRAPTSKPRDVVEETLDDPLRQERRVRGWIAFRRKRRGEVGDLLHDGVEGLDGEPEHGGHPVRRDVRDGRAPPAEDRVRVRVLRLEVAPQTEDRGRLVVREPAAHTSRSAHRRTSGQNTTTYMPRSWKPFPGQKKCTAAP